MPKYVLKSIPFCVPEVPAVPAPPPQPSGVPPCPYLMLQARLAAVAVRNTALHARCLRRLAELDAEPVVIIASNTP